MMSSKRSWQLLIIIIKEKRTMIFGERKNVKNSASLSTFKETEFTLLSSLIYLALGS